MKNINVKDLTDEQYGIIDELIDSRLSVKDQYGDIVEYSVSDCKIDENGVIYAPTSATYHTNIDNGDNFPPEGRYEKVVELLGYEPIYTILKNQ